MSPASWLHSDHCPNSAPIKRISCPGANSTSRRREVCLLPPLIARHLPDKRTLLVDNLVMRGENVVTENAYHMLNEKIGRIPEDRPLQSNPGKCASSHVPFQSNPSPRSLSGRSPRPGGRLPAMTRVSG